jgi:hypothetical protein
MSYLKKGELKHAQSNVFDQNGLGSGDRCCHSGLRRTIPAAGAGLQQPIKINCATAEGDIRMLQSEKAHVAQQVAMGITAIAPAGLVMGVLMGTEQTKLQVATGDYNNMIDQRIAEIKMTCGLL